jgi:K+-sensing histidine kinase KdpD
MTKNNFTFALKILANCLLAVLTVAAITIPLFLIGRSILGEAVIALLYLVPVTWSANRWGQLPGISAALAATLFFNFLFIPPFFTFEIGSLEGWLLLAIFLAVAILVVRWIQNSLIKAREAVFMYEMSTALTGLRTQNAVAHTVARELQQLFQAALVNVIFYTQDQTVGIVASEPVGGVGKAHPDRVLPVLNSWGLAGEIQLWRGASIDLPSDESRLMQNFASQTARALERTQQLENELRVKEITSNTSSK